MNWKTVAQAIMVTTFLLAGAACSSGGSSSGPVVYPTADLPNGPTLTPVSGNNVISFTVNGSTCNPSTSNGYQNKPCVSVTICSTTNTSECQTINDILLDTGSYGLRIFSSVIANNITLTPETRTGGNTIGECVQFGDGSSDWGQVEEAYVSLGGEPSVEVPIQVINATYSNGESNCPGTNPDNNNGPDDSPTEAGFNGILGVGLFAQDCGADCAPPNSSNGTYFSCDGTKCTGTAVLAANQVTNPVTALPTDNNGVILQLPSVPFGGIGSVGGYLIMGINTESNNSSSAVTTYPADPDYGDFSTAFNGQTYSTSFIDSGSNGIFLTSPGIADCSDATGWFCPASTQTFSAVSTGNGGSPSTSIPFYIGNFDDLYQTNNSVFVEIAGDGGGVFDWGLPFFLGRMFLSDLKKRLQIPTGDFN